MRNHYVISEIGQTPVLISLKEYVRANFSNQLSKYSDPNTHTLRNILEENGYKYIVTQRGNRIYYK